MATAVSTCSYFCGSFAFLLHNSHLGVVTTNSNWSIKKFAFREYLWFAFLLHNSQPPQLPWDFLSLFVLSDPFPKVPLICLQIWYWCGLFFSFYFKYQFWVETKKHAMWAPHSCVPVLCWKVFCHIFVFEHPFCLFVMEARIKEQCKNYRPVDNGTLQSV